MRYFFIFICLFSLNLAATDLVDQHRQDAKIEQQKIDNQRVEQARLERQREDNAYTARKLENAAYERKAQARRDDQRRWDRAHGR